MNAQTWWVNARKSGVYSSMLKKMIGQLEAMMSYHSKVHAIRFDLKQSVYTEKNTQITTFNRRLFKWLKRHYKLKRIGFIWCREQETAKHQHYHYVLIIDGHKVEKASFVLNKVKQIWQEISGSYWIPKNCYYNLKRNEHAEIQSAVFRISYLAKARGKGYRPPQTKDYGTSRIKLKNDKTAAN
ncbi:YagK/YfjJ domain-containing protein [Psychromonas sp. MB-3u-54]|uniref:YagK/YfjJ domain-containing protein n=1 Tax=Psychromonas sp. MB-3u-54 TaxID=2058319 RepID=UPI001E4F224A|nr:inovirus-type Gp2 protein [Psychromonas sp. MB-3u-54]